MSEKQTKAIGRRDFIKRGAVAGAIGVAAAGGFALGREYASTTIVREVIVAQPVTAPAPEVPLTPEQKEKQDALRDLAKFMEEHTESLVVANFLASASPSDIDHALTLGTVLEYYGGSSVAWQLRLPQKTIDPDKHVPTISYITDKLNPDSRSPFEQVRVYLNEEGEVKKGLEKDDPNLIIEDDPIPGYNPLSEEGMKLAFARFTKHPMFLFPEGWSVHYRNQKTGKVTEYTKGEVDQQGVGRFGLIQETGYASLTVDLNSSPIIPPPPAAPTKEPQYF